MNEIKFRAWSKRYEYIFEVTKIEFEKIIYGDKPETSFRWNTCELIQFTGLKDKNGKEIFEGDIVELGLQQVEDKILKSRVVVKYKKYGFYPFVDFNDWTIKEEKLIEVIGNIYENSELLGSKR